MKKKINFILSILIFVGITSNTVIAQKKKVSTKDSIALNKLAIDIYKWRHNNNNNTEFIKIGKPDINNVKYESIDWVKYDQHKKTLKETGFFSEKFLKNYKKILSKVNKKLKTNEYEWIIGQVAPFGFEIDIWCKCQKYPKVKEYWNDIALKKLKIKKDGTIKFRIFYHGHKMEYIHSNFNYKVTAIKENGTWKIKTLEGFNKKDY